VQFETYDETQLEKVPDELYCSLADMKVARVKIVYDGYGDSGSIESITAFGQGNTAIDLNIPLGAGAPDQRWHSFSAWVENITWRLLNTHLAGFEIDAGGCGTLTVDVERRTAEFSHTARSYDYDQIEV
jgi:hypothetical protein